MSCQLVGSPIQLAVRQPLCTTFHRHGVRVLCRLRFEQFVQTAVAGVIPGRRIPLVQQQVSLGVIQQIQISHGAIGIGHNLLQQRLEMPHQPFDAGFVEQVRVVLEGCRDGIVPVQHHQHHIEGGALLAQGEGFQAQVPRVLPLLPLVHPRCFRPPRAQPPRLVPAEGHLKNRGPADIPGRVQPFDQQGKGKVLMSDPVDHGLPHLGQQLQKRFFRRDTGSQDDRVQKIPQQVFQFGPAATCRG